MNAKPAAPRPNVVLILTDDQGYGDLGCYGSSLVRTPQIDRMAAEGIRFTDFYSAAPVCTPARANLLTGRYAQRVGLPGVLFPYHAEGLPEGCSTAADCLQRAGYATAMFGKWHLGCRPAHHPLRHGFDEYLGLLYSNDMQPEQLWRDEEIVEEPIRQATLTERYTEGAIRFIRERRDGPFFCYVAHTMPHIPLHVSERFRGKSRAGLYGDVIECIDWSTGEILKALRDLGLDENTLVVFTSDNGPWFEGSVAGLRGRKFDVYEGGIRMPFVARWPAGIPAGQVSREPAAFIDILPTLVGLAGAAPPDEALPLDGLDIAGMLRGGPSPHETLFFYQAWNLNACRAGRWKLHVAEGRSDEPSTKEMPQLYDMVDDPGESYNLAGLHPDVVEDLGGRIRGFQEANPFERRPYTRTD